MAKVEKIPDQVEADLRKAVNDRYPDVFKRLPESVLRGMNPSYSIRKAATGYKAEVTFHFEKGPPAVSLWEYGTKGSWYMYHDWKD